MIINTNQTSDVEVIGDIKEFKTSIDPKNLEYITTLLSSNLYSNPEQSFIREIVSNAWDSHVEAGTTDTPVIIKLSKSEITIRDYGTGISPERFQNIYCNIGSSTKRDSNDYIGGFGLGRFSALACSNTVFIDSFYNGMQYSYVMIKDGNSITTNLILQQPTEEKNGVAVNIKNIKELKNYVKALKTIVFFPNIYVDTSSYSFYYEDDINTIQIKRFKNYACASAQIKNKLLLGNVLYPIDDTYFNRQVNAFLNNIAYTGIVICFNIGELDITPNRENIIYTTPTIKKIEKRILQAKKELEGAIKKCYKSNYTSLESLMSDYRKDNYCPITNKLQSGVSSGGFDYRLSYPKTMRYKGIDLTKEQINFVKTLGNTTVQNIKGLYTHDHYYCSSFPFKYHSFLDLKANIQRVVVSNTIRLTTDVKEYYTSYLGYNDVLFIENNNIKPYLPVIPKDKIPYKRLLLVDYLNERRKNDIIFDPNDKDFLTFKASKVTKKTPVVKDERLNLQEVDKWGCTKRIKYNNMSHLIHSLESLHCGIIMLTKDSPYRKLMQDIIDKKPYRLFIAKKSTVQTIKELNPTFLVDEIYLTQKSPDTSILKTFAQYENEIFSFTRGIDLTTFWQTVNPFFRKQVENILNIVSKYNYDFKGFAKIYGKEDSYTKYVLEKYLHCLKSFTEASNIVDTNYSAIYIGCAIMKMKGFRIPFTLYQKIKENKFLNLLCKRN